MVPNFLIIGAAKSGTTWLVRCLQEIPHIFIPSGEIHYFSRLFETKSPYWYAARFVDSRPAQVVGEKSNSYLSDPNAAQRIHNALPDGKLVTLLRNPIDRAYSGYCMQLERGKVSKDIASYLDPDLARLPHIIENGLYYAQLSRFLAVFPREQIHIALYSDIKAQPTKVIRGVANFIGVPAEVDPDLLVRRVNVKKAHGIPFAYRRLLWPLLRSEAMRRRTLGRLKETGVSRLAQAAISQPLQYPELGEREREKLKIYYADDVTKLSDLLGRDLGSWLE